MDKDKYKTPTNLIKITCDYFSILKEDLISKDRRFVFVLARSIITKILRDDMNYHLVTIGKIINRHHSSVIHHLNIHKNYMFTNYDNYQSKYKTIHGVFKNYKVIKTKRDLVNEKLAEIKVIIKDIEQILIQEYI